MFGSRKSAAHTNEHIVSLVETLRNVTFFDGFSEEDLIRVAKLADTVDAEPGAQLIEQGRVGQECYVILDGTAAVYSNEDHVASLGAGTMVGEMALVDHRPRNASVVAETALSLLVFDTKAFKTLLEEMPLANDRVMQMLAARLKLTNS